MGSFNKLSQTTSVEEYYDQFEHFKSFMVANNPHLPESFYTLSFISGLKEEIRPIVQMFNPETTSRSFYLARIQQADVQHNPKPLKPHTKPFYPTPLSVSHPPSTVKPIFSNSSTYHKQPSPSNNPIITHPTTPTKSDPPIKRLTPIQMKARRDQGLCYNCEEFYRPGHMCRTQQLFMLVAEGENSDNGKVLSDEVQRDSPSGSDSPVDISLHALTGNLSHETIRISGHIHKHPILVLIDTGSTHSFIDSQLSDKLNLHVSPRGRCLL